MNKTFLLGAVAILLMISGCGTKENSTVVEETVAGANSIQDLVNLGKSIKCDLPTGSEGNAIAGTAYISNGRVRSDYTIEVASATSMSGHFILSEGVMYTWSDTYKDQAIKIKVDEMQKPEFKNNAGANLGNFYDKMNYNCRSWTAEDSFFTPPADVNFKDFGEMMNSLFQQTGAGTKSMVCAQCEKITDAKTKAQCRQSIGCN